MVVEGLNNMSQVYQLYGKMESTNECFQIRPQHYCHELAPRAEQTIREL